MKAEDAYLDAIGLMENGDIEKALEMANTAVEKDPEHIDAWWLIADLSLPKNTPPDLKQASRALSACKKVVAINPERVDAWVRGGRLIADELGMYEDALAWWQKCREHVPYEAVPVIEQTAILTDMGMYSEAMGRLESLMLDDLEVGAQQMARVGRLHGLVQKAATQESQQHFKPWQKKHPGWGAIEARSRKAPVSENFIFMLTTVPFLMVEVFLARGLFGDGWGGFCLTSLLILFTVGLGMRFSRQIFQTVNRPAFNLLRAMDVESSSGYTIIPEHLRTQRLYMFLYTKRPKAFQERLELIIKQNKSMPRSWKPTIPDLDSHLDELGYIETEEEGLEAPSYEEE